MVQRLISIAAIIMAAGCTSPNDGIRFEGFYGDRGGRDQTQFKCWRQGERIFFHFEVVDATVCAAEKVNYKRDLEDFDRVEVFFAPNAELSKRYCCIEVDPKGRVLDYRATFPRQMDYGWKANTLKIKTAITVNGYRVEGSIAVSELVAEGIDLRNFHFGAFRADYAPGAKLIDWYSLYPPDGQPADFHRPIMFRQAQL